MIIRPKRILLNQSEQATGGKQNGFDILLKFALIFQDR
jgi:hypothetical protein